MMPVSAHGQLLCVPERVPFVKKGLYKRSSSLGSSTFSWRIRLNFELEWSSPPLDSTEYCSDTVEKEKGEETTATNKQGGIAAAVSVVYGGLNMRVLLHSSMHVPF